MAKYRMNKPEDIRRTLQKVSELVIEGNIDVKQANCIIYACQTALSVIKVEEAIKEAERQKKLSFNELFL